VSLIRFGMRFLLFVVVLEQVGIDNTSFIAIAGAAVFALAFALQGALSNFAAGVMILTFRHFVVGDLVYVAGQKGHVRKIGMTCVDIEQTSYLDCADNCKEITIPFLTDVTIDVIANRVILQNYLQLGSSQLMANSLFALIQTLLAIT
jgi:small-conductance mechanosensitive channel